MHFVIRQAYGGIRGAKPMKKRKNEQISILFLILQIGITMMAAVAVGTLTGYFLGKWLGINWLILAGIILGIAAGYRNVYLTVKKYTADLKPEQIVLPSEEKLKRQKAEEEFRKWKQEKLKEKKEDEEKA